ncbi:sigma-70 family RNA polymerase sigma factor [Candidatus Nomurabacteria bacterium]|uniref:Sigma-70 family RNA polymerase sigma factor n=1 Tax=Candidatus Dojkabacteria bacterium TaxID=2099670 RepID=A0A955I3A7_9BACT|nr:sigma-70 family RNA polymerase sigma factor [Candidatus Dojkabacteria bacterium]MCB9789556.1 sigma-70 family RNA polymerase sigma factor [Candidatus Nomurabacteria bacterium]MCB9803961.1 sigma-70 family RNA polymerase sigma factor [Candidatus Nomurabacteria bacterium]
MTTSEISSLYREHVTKVYRYFYKRTASREISEDLTSQVFLSYAEVCRDPGTQIDDHTKYIFGITRNTFLTYLREKYEKQEFTLDIEDLSHQGTFEDETDEDQPVEQPKDITPLITHYIDLLPEAQQRVMRLRLLEHRSLKEICEILNKNMNYVKTTQKRAIRRLKEILECTPPPTNILKEK